MSIYEDLLKVKIDKIVSEIENIEMDLRCCGNCMHFICNECELKKHSMYETENAFRYCNCWTCDRLKNSERML